MVWVMDYNKFGIRLLSEDARATWNLSRLVTNFTEKVLLMTNWVNKFRCAFRGLGFGITGQSSFYVHIPVAISVLVLAALLKCSAVQWCVLILCIALVWSLELMNSAVEFLARGLCDHQNPWVGKALDTAAAAVLVGSIGSAVIGAIVFATQIF